MLNQTHPNNISINEPLIPSILTFSTILSLIFTFSLIFNIVSIISIITSKQFTPINLLIVNLGLADITYSLGIPFFIIQMFDYNIPFGEIGCKLFIFTEFSGIIVGILTICALSVERFIDVTDTIKNYSHKFKIFLILMYSASSWLFAILFCVPIILSIKLIRINIEMYSCQSEWQDSTLKVYFIVKLIFIFIIPYTIIIISSIKLLIFLNKWKKRFDKNEKTRRKSSKFWLTISIKRKTSELKTDSTELNEKSNKLKKIDLNKNLYEPNSVVSFDATTFINSANSRKYSYSTKVIKNASKKTNIFDLFKTKSKIKKSKRKSKYINSIRRKAIRLVLIIILLFLVQWSPFWIFQILILFSTSHIKYIQIINMIVSTLSYSNTVANPALYMLLTYNFKENWRKFLLKISNCFKN